jgi:hypothetical protein
LSPVGDLASPVENASAAYFGTTAAPHEYFDQAGIFQQYGQNLRQTACTHLMVCRASDRHLELVAVVQLRA